MIARLAAGRGWAEVSVLLRELEGGLCRRGGLWWGTVEGRDGGGLVGGAGDRTAIGRRLRGGWGVVGFCCWRGLGRRWKELLWRVWVAGC